MDKVVIKKAIQLILQKIHFQIKTISTPAYQHTSTLINIFAAWHTS
jgi:hypothetical protein